MSDKSETIYIINNNNVDKIFEYIGKVTTGVAISFALFYALKKAIGTDYAQSLISKIKSR